VSVPPAVPRVVIAPDKFKGTLSAREVATHLRRGLLAQRPGLDVQVFPIADGGEGTLHAAWEAGFERVDAPAHGPTGVPGSASYARRADTAVIELASVSGLACLPGGTLAPLRATSRGAGDLMAAALDAGCRQLILGIGGSSSTDGGAGVLRGLGARLLDASGADLAEGGTALRELSRLDLSGLHPGLANARVIVARDVDNPLLGSRGAAAVYGPQKGASPEDVRVLEDGLRCWAEVVTATVGRSAWDEPGSGAAGGVGFAALAVLGATLVPGIEVLMQVTGLEKKIPSASLVVTGEGSLDDQTPHGKAPAGVAAAARRAGVPVVVVAGQSTLDPTTARATGFDEVYTLADVASSLEECFARPGPLLEELGRRIAADRFPSGRRGVDSLDPV
jgi:glycerate kinase